MGRPEIPHQPLTLDQARALAKAMARGDAKRLGDLLDRMGGLDYQAFLLLADPPDHAFSLIGQEALRSGRNVSGALAARTLARSAEQVFDRMLEAALGDKTHAQNRLAVGSVWSRLGEWGAGSDPRFVEKMLDACQRRGSIAQDCEMILQWARMLGDDVNRAHSQAQTWNVQGQRGRCQQLFVQRLALSSSSELAELAQELSSANALPEIAQAACDLVKQAQALHDGQALRESAAPAGSAKPPRL